MAQHINEMKRKHEHAVRIQEIQSQLSDWDGADLTTYGDLVLEVLCFNSVIVIHFSGKELSSNLEQTFEAFLVVVPYLLSTFQDTFRMYGAKAERHLFLFEKSLLIAKKSEDGILACKHCIEVKQLYFYNRTFSFRSIIFNFQFKGIFKI